MVKAVHGKALGFETIDQTFSDELVLEKGNKEKAVYVDQNFPMGEMAWVGSGFGYDGDQPTKGTVEKIVFTDAEGELLMTIRGFEIKATTLTEFLATEGLQGTLEFLFEGKDTIIGTKVADQVQGYDGNDVLKTGKGQDYLWGGEGRDRYTGGSGADVFNFRIGDGKDVITDFDAEGGYEHQDMITWDGGIADPDISMKNGNTILDFGEGDILVLLGVHKSEIDASDFMGPV